MNCSIVHTYTFETQVYVLCWSMPGINPIILFSWIHKRRSGGLTLWRKVKKKERTASTRSFQELAWIKTKSAFKAIAVSFSSWHVYMMIKHFHHTFFFPEFLKESITNMYLHFPISSVGNETKASLSSNGKNMPVYGCGGSSFEGLNSSSHVAN